MGVHVGEFEPRIGEVRLEPFDGGTIDVDADVLAELEAQVGDGSRETDAASEIQHPLAGIARPAEPAAQGFEQGASAHLGRDVLEAWRVLEERRLDIELRRRRRIFNGLHRPNNHRASRSGTPFDEVGGPRV